jgi:hypothetical protein
MVKVHLHSHTCLEGIVLNYMTKNRKSFMSYFKSVSAYTNYFLRSKQRNKASLFIRQLYISACHRFLNIRYMKKKTAVGTGRLLAIEERSVGGELLICVDYFRIQLTFQ